MHSDPALGYSTVELLFVQHFEQIKRTFPDIFSVAQRTLSPIVLSTVPFSDGGKDGNWDPPERQAQNDDDWLHHPRQERTGITSDETPLIIGFR